MIRLRFKPKKSMNTIAENERYELKVDKAINRLFITIKGYWKGKEGYLEDLSKSLEHMNSGFKIHVDLTQMKTPPAEIGEVHVEAQKMLMDAGLAQTAEVLGSDAIAKIAIKKYSKNSGMAKQVFDNHQDAEAWLNEN